MEKTAQQRKIRNIISPLNFVGRKYLSFRSPIYKEAQAIIEKADGLFRNTVQTQKGYLKNLKKDKRDLAAVRLSQRTAAFLREQVLLTQTTDLIGEKFSQIEGVNVPVAQLKDINYYISNDIGKTPEYNPNQVVEKDVNMEEEWDQERPSIWGRFVTEYFGRDYGVDERSKRLEKSPLKASETEFYSEIVKDAFLASWFWSRTQSGKDYKKAFNTICVGAENMVNANLALLKKLDDLRTKGDPQAYWDACKNASSGFKATLTKYGESKAFLDAWQKFESYLPKVAVEPEPVPETESDDETTTEMPPDVAPVTETPAAPNTQQMEQAVEPSPVNTYEENIPIDLVNRKKSPMPPAANWTTDEEPLVPPAVDNNDEEDADKLANTAFIHNLIKQADDGKSKEEIALDILKYAELIDNKNPKLSLQLMAIVEGIINE
jgi:hypothetical protein